ncbi:hypothetical protein KP509_24G009800 [Ceratopteris richardii]|uniref:Uncharacterized protein n=1 Tax=Ceratopteris richardii TaxID=49495 RepID=A0A8T2RV84_CERRI|nr:hypothetical protein KP509_24G009800 [Ceratopteris richardii]
MLKLLICSTNGLILSLDSRVATRWWNEDTVAVVTGGNKGIGLEVCKQLGVAGLKVVLTARNADRGQIAMETLKNEGLQHVSFHPLDVADKESCSTFASWLSKEHGGLDILVNNAGVGGVVLDDVYVRENNIILQDLMWKNMECPKGFIVDYQSARSCIETNYYGAKRVTEALLPLMRPSVNGARIINVGSYMGQLHNLRCSKLQEELSDLENVSEAFIDKLLDMYLNDVKQQTWQDKCWPLKYPSYKVSKIALHTYTRLLARQLEKRGDGNKVFVNCVHPGFVNTDMTGKVGDISAKEGAENIVRVALLPSQDSPSGQFYYEDKPGVF